MDKGLARAGGQCVHLTLGASPDTSANLVSAWGSQGVSWGLEWGGASLGRTGYCVSRPFPWKGGASMSRKPWLAFKATTDLLIQPQNVWSCGRSWGCRGHPLGKGRGQPEGASPAPTPCLPAKAPSVSNANPPSPTTSLSGCEFWGDSLF